MSTDGTGVRHPSVRVRLRHFRLVDVPDTAGEVAYGRTEHPSERRGEEALQALGGLSDAGWSSPQ